ncbi:MAG: phosphopantetheine-binding protein [Acidobacteria bacterium]|jgi:acyl carrier protein|nr:phosphopantetheine-binding protein [Acidobacteriota bacterium]MCU0254047.1 phosphopantetheine-binding protein [Acidobacteriota bacterium]
MTSDTRERLERLVIARSKLRLARVSDDERLNYELGYDSAALLALLLDAEDAFGIEVPPERVPELAGAPFARLVALVEAARARAEERA